MILKFIGKDGSLGLKHGEKYKVTLKTSGKYFIATIHVGWINQICPYGSVQAFAKNWELN
jgi:hypothetical protein